MFVQLKKKIAKCPWLYEILKTYKSGLSGEWNPIDDKYRLRYKVEKRSFGNANPDKNFCIITLGNVKSASGTFELFMNIALMAVIAEAMGYVPVIDFKNYKISNWVGVFADHNINYWDIFFRQYQLESDLEEVYRSKNVFFLKLTDWGLWSITYDLDKFQHSIYHNIYEKIGINENKFEKDFKASLPSKTLGITIRRAMERGNKMHESLYTEWMGHHIRGHICTYAKWIYDNLEKLGYKQFFLCTEDRETLEFMKKEFGSQCLYFDRHRLHCFVDGRPVSSSDKEYGIEYSRIGNESDLSTALGSEYISETIMLSKCDAILKNIGGQECMARIMRKDDIPLVANHIFLDMYG